MPVVLLGCAALFQGLAVVETLRWERGLLLAEPWRLLTAHLVHLGWVHLGLNALGAALLGVVVGRALSPTGWLGAGVVSALAVSGGLAIGSPTVQWYVGFSGVLHGLLAAGGITAFRSTPWVSWVLLLALSSKLLLEWFATEGSPVSGLIGGAVVTDAHLYGALGGALAGLLGLAFHRERAAGSGRAGFG